MNIKNKKSLGLVIVDGVGYRNFILSEFLNEAAVEFGKVIIYSGLKRSVFDISEYKNVEVKELEIYVESRKTWFLRKLNETAHLYKFKSFFGIADTLHFTKPKGYGKRALLNRIIRLIASIFHSEKCFKVYQQNIYKSFSNDTVTKGFINTLKFDTPDILFFTHQRPPYIAPLVYVAKLLNIKTCAFIFSWDNLSSKGRIPALFDSFLVWSDLMKTELEYFYPNIKSSNVKVVGTPQFEPYVMNTYKVTKEDFINKFKLDLSKKTLCFSCGDLSTGRNDILAVEIIAEAILNNDIEPINFIVRTSPADDGSRFDVLKKKYNFICWNFPKWIQTREKHVEPWSQRVPLVEDIKDLRAVLEYADISVNMCSTMSLDFMIFNKPVVNQVLGNKENGLFNDQRFLNYNHYKTVVENGAVAIAKNEKELIEQINYSLINPFSRMNEQKKILTLQIGKPLEGTSKRIVEVLRDI